MLQRLWSQIGDLYIIAGVAFVFACIKELMAPGARTFRVVVASAFISCAVGTLAGFVAMDFGYGDSITLVATSLGTLTARELVSGILNNKEFLGSLLKRAAENITDKVTK